MSRGQTTIDFLVGTSVFLLAVAMVVFFVPGMIDPFATGREGHSVTVNRAVTSLATDELVDPSKPYVLNASKTDQFFTQGEPTIKGRLGLSDSVHVNATLRNSTGVIDATGPTPPNHASVSTAWRVVSYRDEQAELTVRMW